MNIFSVSQPTSFWDIGTSVGRLYTHERGLVVSEPAFVALRKETRDVFLMGKDAYVLREKITPHVDVIPAMKNGIIASEKALSLLISTWKNILDENERFSLLRPRAIVTVPFSCDPTHRRAMVRAFENAGMGDVVLVPSSLCIGISHNQDIAHQGGVIVDMGAGKTEIVCMVGEDVPFWRSLPCGGEKLDEYIVSFLEEEHGVLISQADACMVKLRCHIGKTKKREAFTVRGRNAKTGELVTITLAHEEVVSVIQAFLREVLDFFSTAYEQIPDAFLTSMRANGIVLAGGMSQMPGIQTWFEEQLQLPVSCVSRPSMVVVLGAAKIWSDWQRYSYVQIHTHA